MKSENLKELAIKEFRIIKFYCETVEASGWDDRALRLLKEEFKPIIEACENAIKKMEEL
jgi:hypothetical protein